MSGTVFQFPFRLGLAEGDDPKALPPGSLLTAVNCQADKGGRLAKRYGTTGLTKGISGGGSLAAGKRIFPRGSELCMIDGTSLYSYSAGAGSWVNTGKISEVGLTWTTAVDAMNGVQSSDVAVLSNGNVVHAWVAGDPNATTSWNVFLQVLDSNGVRIAGPTAINPANNQGNSVRIITDGTNYAVLYTKYGATSIFYSWNGAQAAQLSTAVTPNTTRAAFDAQINGSTFWLAYEASGGGIELEIMSFVSSPVSQAHIAVSGTAGLTNFLCIAINGTAGENLYVAYTYSLTTHLLMAVHNPTTLAQTLAPVTIDSSSSNGEISTCALARFDSSHAIILYWAGGDPPSGVMAESPVSTRVVAASNGAATAGASRTSYGAVPLSRPFQLNGRWYMYLADANRPGQLQAQNSYLVEIETSGSIGTATWPHRYVGKIDVLIGGPYWGYRVGGVLPNVSAVSSTQALAVLPFQASVNV